MDPATSEEWINLDATDGQHAQEHVRERTAAGGKTNNTNASTIDTTQRTGSSVRTGEAGEPGGTGGESVAQHGSVREQRGGCCAWRMFGSRMLNVFITFVTLKCL